MDSKTYTYHSNDKKILDKLVSSLNCSSPGFIYDGKPLVVVDYEAKVEDVLKLLIENRILSMPIIKDYKAVGIISILDLVTHALKHFDKTNLKEMDRHGFNFFSLVSEKNMAKEQPVSSLTEIGKTDKIIVLHQLSPLTEAINLLATKDAHRVLVLGDLGQPVNIITQSKIIQLINFVMDSLYITQVSVGELGIAKKEVVSVLDSDMARDAFQKMKDKHISGVAVLNKTGSLVGNISASDIKLLGHSLEWFDTLGGTCAEYLVSVKKLQDKIPIRSRAFHLGSSGSSNVVVKCSPNSTLGVVIRLILFYEVHRVYVTDSMDDKLIGIISLGDIIKTVFNL